MKLYTIGEVIHKFNSPKSVAYAIKGEMEGSMIYADMNNRGLLTTMFPDGDIVEVFAIKYSPEATEGEERQWVFLDELEEDDSEQAQKILADIVGLQTKLLTSFLEGLRELSPEEQMEVLEELTKYAGDFLK
jgi:hypothetical protein